MLIMSYISMYRLRGKFYLETRDEPPFGRYPPTAHYTVGYNVTEPSVRFPEGSFFDIVTLMTTTNSNSNKMNNKGKVGEKGEGKTIYHLQYPGWLPKEEDLKALAEEELIGLYYSIDYEKSKSSRGQELRENRSSRKERLTMSMRRARQHLQYEEAAE